MDVESITVARKRVREWETRCKREKQDSEQRNKTVNCLCSQLIIISQLGTNESR